MLRAHWKLSKSWKTLVQHHYDPVEKVVWCDFGTEMGSIVRLSHGKAWDDLHQNQTPLCTLMLRAHWKLSKSWKTLAQHQYNSVEKVEFTVFQREIVRKPDQFPEQGFGISGSWRFWTEMVRKCVSSRSAEFSCQWRSWWVPAQSLITENDLELDISAVSMRMQHQNHGFGQNPFQPCNSLVSSKRFLEFYSNLFRLK